VRVAIFRLAFGSAILLTIASARIVSAALPGAFTLTSATPGCNGTSPQVTVTWSASSGVSTYDLYRNGTLYSSGIPAGTLSFLNTGSNVTPGTTYTYFVRAKNTSGSTDSNSLSATAPSSCGGTPPGAFTLTSATPGCNGTSPQVTVTWSASSGVSTYDLYRNGTLYSSGIPAGTLSFLNTGSNVTPGTTYTYFVRAKNTSGSTDSNSLSATAPGSCGGSSLPGAPQFLAAYPGNGLNGLGWNPPATNGGSAITGYRVYRGTTSSNRQLVTSGGCANLSAVTSCADTGLTNGQSYDYVVTAVNGVGEGPQSNSASAIPNGSGATSPSAPQSLAAYGGNGQNGLAWNAPASNGGSTITGYRVYRGTTNSNRQLVTSGGCASLGVVTSCADTGLNNGQSYDYVVTAVNGVGEGPQSNSVTAAPTAGSATWPSEPLNFTASPGNGQNSLAWNAPASSGGAPITNYRVFRGTNASNTSQIIGGGCANLGVVLSCTDTGLTNGQTYYYIVSAVNSAGQSPPSNPATATPTGSTVAVPSAPLNLTASPGNGQNSLSWSPPSSNGGAVIISYRVYRGTNASNTSLIIVGGCATLGAVLSCTDTGLTNGQQYYYTVSAVNNAGQGQSSSGVTATPGGTAAPTVPGAPLNLNASPGNGQNLLGWSAPTSNGGAPVTSYRVARGTSAGNTAFVVSGGCANLGAVLGCSDTGLTNGQAYYYFVYAVNSVGQGPPSNSANATPGGVSSAKITMFVAEPATVDAAGQTVTLKWTTSDATATSIDNGIGSVPVNGQLTVAPSKTTTYTLTATGVGNPVTSQVTVTVKTSLVTSLTLGGITFDSDSIVQTTGGYTLSGATSLNKIITYTGSLAIAGPDSAGRFTLSGSGVLRVPAVNVPGLGPLVLYDGSFSIPFKNGTLYQFIENYTRFTIAGWKLRMDEVRLTTDGIVVTGSLRIPQYAPGLSAIHLDATVSATRSGGIRLDSGGLKVNRIGLAGAYSLENIDISYDRDHDEFDGSGTLKTPAFGLAVGVKVVKACLSGATLTISRVPIVLGTTGLQLNNYGIDATGFCGADPFGIGLHTDITFAGNPDPDALEFQNVNAMYFPLTSLRGGGTIKIFGASLGEATFYFNYSDHEVSCNDGLCVMGKLGLPTLDEAWILGQLDGRVMLHPFRLYASPVLRFQVPKSCFDLDLSWGEKLLCPIIATYCGGNYPCVIGEASGAVTIQPGADPEATIAGKLSLRGHSIGARVTYNEKSDRRFHFHFGDGSASSRAQLLSSALNGSAQFVIAPGTPDAYFGLNDGTPGTAPNLTLVGPNGARYGKNGGPGIDYYADSAHGAAVFAVTNPAPGTWTVESGSQSGNVLSYASAGMMSVAIKQVIVVGATANITWKATGGATSSATVTLSYAGSFDGPDLGVIADSQHATGTDQTTPWTTASLDTGGYYVRARITDSLGVTVTTTWPKRVSIVAADAPAPPSQLQAVTNAPGIIDVSWQASPTASVVGYIVVIRAGGMNAEVRRAVGNTLATQISGLDASRGYEVWAEAQDGGNRVSTASNVVAITWRTCAPAATLTVPTLAALDDPINFDARVAADGCAGVTSYEWSFGDGATANTPQARHVYDSVGEYHWTLNTTTDGQTTQSSDVLRVVQGRCALTILQPFGGAVLTPRSPTTVSWSSDGACGKDVRIELLRDVQVIETISASAAFGFLVWTPSDHLGGADWHMRITDRETGVVVVSNAFAIGGPPRRRAAKH
jgi:fibronectin type 3 domain-containing protein